MGHCEKVCITSLIKASKNPVTSTNTVQAISTLPESFTYDVNKLLIVVDLFEVTDSDKYYITVQLNGKF